MSTFNGLVAEFPEIRIDFFRKQGHLRPPLACFLSHVHSDHLAGLENLRSPFVYCSAATREMLLCLERYPCRINYARGILEARVQTYKHLKNLLKPLPLDTPTTLELAPGRYIQVTLLDANHCPGSVMFLIEDSRHAILYTGDIRSEPWFLNAMARNPAIVEYTYGIKKLDKIYLDTSFIRSIPFPTKADGIAELLRKVALYPDNTVFHFQAWTYGYEQVWIALSKALRSRIHVDDYKMRIFSSLTGKTSNDRFSSSIHLCPEAPALTGYVCGNKPHPGCLTRDEHVRLHSCERGNFCSVVRDSRVVFIQPIIVHMASGAEMAEVGIGGGGDDLERDVVLDNLSLAEVDAVLALVDEKSELSQDSRMRLQELLETGAKTGWNMSLDLDMSSLGEMNEAATLDALKSIGQKKRVLNDSFTSSVSKTAQQLPETITFPYSRHSSYQELCALVQVFQPRDVWPCTVNPTEWIKDNITMRSLFGNFCAGDVFEHDVEMEKLAGWDAGTPEQRAAQNLHGSQLSGGDNDAMASHFSQENHATKPMAHVEEMGETGLNISVSSVVAHQSFREEWRCLDGEARDSHGSAVLSTCMRTLPPSCGMSRVRADAYQIVARNLVGREWTPIGLLSTLDHHTTVDKDLGGN